MALLLDAVGAIGSGIAQQNAAEYNAAVDRNNAIQANQAAQQQAAAKEQEVQSRLGTEKAAYGASGVDVSQGTPVAVMSNTAAQGKLDAMTLLYGGHVRANADLNAARLAQYEGDVASTTGYIDATAGLLKGAAKIQAAGGF